ncbi:hypothetical protein AAMO2058_001324000 [Amorphochlora amoebiformis]
MSDILLAPSYWLFWSTGPLSGFQRSVFYFGLLILALRDEASPLSAGYTLDIIPSPIYVPPLQDLGLFPLSRATVFYLETIAKLTWIFCILGLGGWFTRATLAATAMMLHGVQSGAVGSNHRWVIPMYTLWALVFCGNADTFSLDSWLWDIEYEDIHITRSGYGRQLVVLVSCFTFFAGGVSKLRESGLKWMDGRTMQHHLTRAQNAISEDLARFMASHLWICQILSFWTIAFELTCYFVVAGPITRFLVFAQANVFHLGVAITMKPKFWPQMWCYTLAFDISPFSNPYEPVIPSVWWHIIGFVTWGILGGMIWVGYTGLEAWPFTSVPMYGQYRALGVERYPTSRKEIANIRNWNTCMRWNKHFTRIIIDTIHQDKTREYRSLFPVLIEKDYLPLHTRTEYLRAMWNAMIDSARKKDSGKSAEKYLEKFAAWLRSRPHVLGPGTHHLRLKLRVQKKAKSKKKVYQPEAGNTTLFVEGAGEFDANGHYNTSRKPDKTLRIRDGVPIYRRVAKGEARVRYTICRENSAKSGERKWWLYKNTVDDSKGRKWSKKDVDLYNVHVKMENSENFPPERGWKSLSSATPPPPTVTRKHNAPEAKQEAADAPTERNYQLGTIASVKI